MIADDDWEALEQWAEPFGPAPTDNDTRTITDELNTHVEDAEPCLSQRQIKSLKSLLQSAPSAPMSLPQSSLIPR